MAFPVQIVVQETKALLQDLLPDTDYNVGVVALYSDGEGPAISDAGKTRKNPKHRLAARGAAFWAGLVFSCIRTYAKILTLFLCRDPVPRSGPRNLRVYDPTTNSLSVSWEPAKGPVTQYRITYAPTTGDPIEEYVSVLRDPHYLEQNGTSSSGICSPLCFCRQQYQQTETTLSCRTWIQTRLTTSK